MTPSPTPDPGIPRSAGLELAPFAALRYDVARAGGLAAVTSPPYDVIDEAERAALEDRSPYNIVRLILPRDSGPEPTSRYAAAARSLAAWRRDGVLRMDPSAALYVYEETSDGHVQRGLLGAVGLQPPEAGVILPHENTMAGPVADRLALTEATATNLEPIFLVYEGGGAASEAVAAVDTAEPLLVVRTDDGVTHRLWSLTEPELLGAVAGDLAPRRAVIADGHHRYATYLQHQRNRHAAGAGRGPWDRGLAFLVDVAAFGPQVHAIHRTVPGLGLPAAARLAADGFRVEPVDGGLEPGVAALAAAGAAGPAFLLVGADGAGSLLTEPDPDRLAAALPAQRSAAWRGLDVTIAHRYLIGELWGLADREDVVLFHHDVPAAVRAAADTGGTALLLNPTPVGSVAAVAAAGERMPRKSTLFTPKPRTGLVLRPLAG